MRTGIVNVYFDIHLPLFSSEKEGERERAEVVYFRLDVCTPIPLTFAFAFAFILYFDVLASEI